MKKIYVLFIMLAAATVTGKAQLFLEGSLGVKYNTQSGDIYSSPFHVSNPSPYLSINVSPKVGYWLNSNVAVGTNISHTYDIRKYIITDPNDPNNRVEIEIRTPEWRFSIFGRYKLWGTEKLSVLIETPVGIGGSATKEKTGTTTKKTQSESVFFFNAFPVISYNLTDRFSVITTCNFLSLDFSSNTKI